MSSTNRAGLEIYMTGLRNQHAVENQAIELLSRQVDRLENYPEMEARMRQHIEESRSQAQRLEELLSSLDSSHSAAKDAALSLAGNMAALMHTVAPDEVVKNSFANYAFEHFEIAAYKSLLVLAEALGRGSEEAVLKRSLAEELDMAQWIDLHLADTTLRFLQRSEAGLKAGL
jgi:ferritin-like metal-binding protein YciE